MPAKNVHHSNVVEALKSDGWTITHDPFRLSYAGREMYVDLGAERNTLAAEKGDRRIAVEVQSFIGPSPVRALQEAVGQFQVYRLVLSAQEPERVLYMAVERKVQDEFLGDRFGQFILSGIGVPLIVFDASQQRIVQWID